VALEGPGGANTTISPDAIQEYRVITNDFPAEYGKAGGFVTDTVLKGGTNQWHGSAFEYNRTQAYTANDWFSNNASPQIRDHLVRNQFGGSLGGPIKKDKTFFYGTGELHRLRTSTPVTATQAAEKCRTFAPALVPKLFSPFAPARIALVGAPFLARATHLGLRTTPQARAVAAYAASSRLLLPNETSSPPASLRETSSAAGRPHA